MGPHPIFYRKEMKMANEVKYADQTWTTPESVAGEQLSVNGYYTGEHVGTPTQDGTYSAGNADPHWVEHNTVRFGTIMQDGASNANMPEQSDAAVKFVLTGCSTNGGAAVKGDDYNAVFVPDAGYTLPTTITVKNGGIALIVTTDYTWSNTTGALKVTGSKITGDLEITVTATAES